MSWEEAIEALVAHAAQPGDDLEELRRGARLWLDRELGRV